MDPVRGPDALQLLGRHTAALPVECDLCVLTFDGKCPSGYEYSWYRFNTEVNFNADDGVGTLPLGFVEAPHNPRITMQTIAFFPRLELCCRIC